MKFFMLIGLPGSGKSTIAKELSENENAKIFSSDAIREELYGDANVQENPNKVFSLLHKRIKQTLNLGTSVIYDATNISSKRRIAFLGEIKNYNIEKIAVLVATPYAECISRNSTRDRVVPDFAIKKMYMSFNVPSINEGFSEVKVIYNSNDIFSKYTDIVNDFKNIPHDNPHHKENIGEHMELALKHFDDNFDKYFSMLNDPSDITILRYAILLHDIGKPFCKTYMSADMKTPSNHAHYYNHENVGSYDVLFTDIPENIKLDVSLLIQYHMRYYTSWKQSEKSYEKDERFLGTRLFKMLEILHECDMAAHIEE